MILKCFCSNLEKGFVKPTIFHNFKLSHRTEFRLNFIPKECKPPILINMLGWNIRVKQDIQDELGVPHSEIQVELECMYVCNIQTMLNTIINDISTEAKYQYGYAKAQNFFGGGTPHKKMCSDGA